VAFDSDAANLVADDTNGQYDVFVHDRWTGATERVSVDSAGEQATGAIGSSHPSISADGRFVAFHSSATNLVNGDTNNQIDVFVHDRQTGATERVNVTGANWVKIHRAKTQDFTVGDFDGNGTADLLVDFGKSGLWLRSSNSGWTRVHAASARRMISADLDSSGKDDSVVSFSGAGLWVWYNNTAWVKVSNAAPQAMAAGGLDKEP
jgi:hypothetical protein